MNSRRQKLDKIGINSQRETHAGLWLDKYIATQDREKTGTRSDFVNDVSLLPIPEVYATYYQRWETALKDNDVRTRIATVKGRMIVGLGDESVLETSIALHRTYGVPYIPGSALKGLAASYARQRLDEKWQRGSEAYNVIFGDTDDAGYITFFDALYKPGTGHASKALHPDVITVHHQQYYQSSGNTPTAPTDRDNPIPVPFLSATGSYLIALAAPELEQQQRNEWIKSTFTILGGALKEMGIGAKTSSGYGRMELEALALPPVDPELQSARRYKQEIDRMQNKDVANQIQGYYQKWQQIKSNEGRIIVARAIVEKVGQAGREKASAEKAWYKELRAFLGEA